MAYISEVMGAEADRHRCKEMLERLGIPIVSAQEAYLRSTELPSWPGEMPTEQATRKEPTMDPDELKRLKDLVPYRAQQDFLGLKDERRDEDPDAGPPCDATKCARVALRIQVEPDGRAWLMTEYNQRVLDVTGLEYRTIKEPYLDPDAMGELSQVMRHRQIVEATVQLRGLDVVYVENRAETNERVSLSLSEMQTAIEGMDEETLLALMASIQFQTGDPATASRVHQALQMGTHLLSESGEASVLRAWCTVEDKETGLWLSDRPHLVTLLNEAYKSVREYAYIGGRPGYGMGPAVEMHLRIFEGPFGDRMMRVSLYNPTWTEDANARAFETWVEHWWVTNTERANGELDFELDPSLTESDREARRAWEVLQERGLGDPSTDPADTTDDPAAAPVAASIDDMIQAIQELSGVEQVVDITGLSPREAIKKIRLDVDEDEDLGKTVRSWSPVRPLHVPI